MKYRQFTFEVDCFRQAAGYMAQVIRLLIN